MEVIDIKSHVNNDAVDVLENALRMAKSGEIKSVAVAWVTSENGIHGDVSSGDDAIRIWAAIEHTSNDFYKNVVVGDQMPRLSPDWKPSQRTYDNLRKHGAVPEFVDSELEMFMTYFLDPDLPKSKAVKSSWEMTCQRWMRSAWKGKAGRDWEYNRHKRTDFNSNGLKPFEAMAGQEKPKPARKRKYKLPERPAVEPMSREEVFKQMREQGIIK